MSACSDCEALRAARIAAEAQRDEAIRDRDQARRMEGEGVASTIGRISEERDSALARATQAEERVGMATRYRMAPFVIEAIMGAKGTIRYWTVEYHAPGHHPAEETRFDTAEAAINAVRGGGPC